MTRRPYNRPPEGRHRDRADRRAVVDVLLARAHRGVLSRAEVALLAEHVREEQRVADENRRAMAGTTQALDRVRAQLAAAEAAIVEAERDRDQAEERAKEADRRAAVQRAAVDRVLDLVGRLDAVPATAVWAAVDADPVEHRQAVDLARDWKTRQGAALAAVERVRVLAQRMRAGSPQGAAAIYADRIEQALDNDRRALDADTAIRAQFLAAADSTTARLAEQQREHDVALAASRRNVAEASREAPEQQHRARRYRLAWLAARRDRKADRAAMAADLATLRAVEAHRDRLARDVEAMHDGINQAAHEAFAERKRHRAEVRAQREQHEQQLAAVRAALPDEPRPRLGLPNDLAYANGRHDLAAAVRAALDQASRT
ncbi:hypothetical protein [Streptomyces sp. FR-008]|uniref:hypothetical protein n=1 Tax=Streptomyces sp. FR-008 TaxID=206662 RepID=UPI00096B2FCC|nr:hypothetical protein [Streptomyces sp. FR-008]KAF0795858.1 hypothetical protein P405_00420 [Streptomyces sp. FR-008]